MILFINAVTALLHLPALRLLPFWCSSLCAAHPPSPEGMPSVPDERYKLPNIASKAFLSLKNLTIKAYLKVRLEISDLGRLPPIL